MCGIVGLLIKAPELRAQLGELMVPMLVGMTERGPDSAGLAVYTAPVSGCRHKLSLHAAGEPIDWQALAKQLEMAIPQTHDFHSIGNHALLVSAADPEAIAAWLSIQAPSVAVLSVGHSIELYKDVGAPVQIAERYRFSSLQGSHLVGHTRMATESAVTPAHAHPFTAGRDFCLVHNGSLSNPHLVRKKLETWHLWILVDIVYIPLYITRGLHLTAVLYAVFLVMAVLGLRHWRASLARTTALPIQDVMG